MKKVFNSIFKQLQNGYWFNNILFKLIVCWDRKVRQPGLHTSRKDRKYMVANTFLSFPGMPWSSYSCNDRSYSYFTRKSLRRYTNDIPSLALKPSLEHDRNHGLRLLRLYEDQA